MILTTRIRHLRLLVVTPLAILSLAAYFHDLTVSTLFTSLQCCLAFLGLVSLMLCLQVGWTIGLTFWLHRCLWEPPHLSKNSLLPLQLLVPVDGPNGRSLCLHYQHEIDTVGVFLHL